VVAQACIFQVRFATDAQELARKSRHEGRRAKLEVGAKWRNSFAKRRLIN